MSPDEALAWRVRRALRDGEVLRHVLSVEPLGQARPEDGREIVALDCRGMDLESAEHSVQVLRVGLSHERPIVALCNRVTPGDFKVIGAIGPKVSEVLLSECDALEPLLRAILNDPTGTTAPAIALAACWRRLPSAALPILDLVLGGGLRVTTVKAVTTALDENRSTLEARLRNAKAPAPRVVVDLALASAAVVEGRSIARSLHDLTRYVGLQKAESLRKLLNRAFHLSLARVLSDKPERSPGLYLESLLQSSGTDPAG